LESLNVAWEFTTWQSCLLFSFALQEDHTMYYTMSPNVQLSHIYPILIPFIHTSTKQRASTNYSGLSPLVPSSRGPSACMHRATQRTNGSLPTQHLVTVFSFCYWTPRYGGIRGLLRFFGGEITGRVFRDWADWLTLLAIVARAWVFWGGGGAWICISPGTLVRWANWDTTRGCAVDSSADGVDVRAACTSALRTPIADVANVRAAYTRSLWARLDVSRSRRIAN
jgi:hypothetical protein